MSVVVEAVNELLDVLVEQCGVRDSANPVIQLVLRRQVAVQQ
jgi:hypothetical protein